jgi:hypothetical protein
MGINLNVARAAYIKAKTTEYGALRKYAEALTEQFGDKWWEIPMKGPVNANESKVRDAIRTEKKLVQEASEAKGLKNVYKPWSDVLAYVKPKADKGANANAPREIHERLKVELTKLYKAVRNDDNADTEVLAQTNWHIGKALERLGIDLTDLNVQN